MVLLPHVFQFQKGPHSPSPFSAPLFFPVFFHPSPSICRSLSRFSFLYFTAPSAVSPSKRAHALPTLPLSLSNTLSLSSALPSIVFRRLHVPLHAPKTSPRRRFMRPRIFSLSSSLFASLLNCLWIYNLARRECVWASSADKICICVCCLNQIWLRLRGVNDLLRFMRASIVEYGFRGSLVAFVTTAECERMPKYMTRIYDGITSLTKSSSVLFLFNLWSKNLISFKILWR